MKHRLMRTIAALCMLGAAAACTTDTVYSPTATYGAIVLSPSSLAFTAAGASNAQSVTAAQSHYNGNFTASTAASGSAGSCNGIATISNASGKTLSVTPVAAGSCTFTIAGGGGSSATLAVGVTTTTVGGTNSQSSLVAFRIIVPSASGAAARHRPAYVSASTKSASIAVAPAGGTPSAPVIVNCTSVCSGTVNAPVGGDTFVVNLYDGQNASGNLLSTGTLTQPIVADTANSVNVTFNGVVASLAVALGASATAGTPATIPVTVNARDADGNTIVGPGIYVSANGSPLTIALTDSDATGATTLSQTTLTQPASGIKLAYTGLAIAPASIAAAASGVTTASASFAPALQPIVYSGPHNGTTPQITLTPFSSSGTFTASEAGWTNAPYDKSIVATEASNCTTIATTSPASGTSFTATAASAAAPGSCTLTLSDFPGGSTATVNLLYAIPVFVADTGNSEVKEILPSASIDVLGSGFAQPAGVAVDATGDVFVADTGNNAVEEIAAPGYGSVTSVGSKFSSPQGVAVDSSGNVYVADTGNAAIKVILANSGSVENIDSGSFAGPTGVAVDGAGNVFVADPPSSAVYVVGSIGYGAVTQLGSGFSAPAGVAVEGSGSNEKVFVTDSAANAVYELEASEGFATPHALAGSYSAPTGIAVDAAGNVYVADTGHNAVKEIVAPAYTTVNTIGSGFTSPRGVAVP